MAVDNSDVKNSSFVRGALENTVVQLKARIRELTEDNDHLRGIRGKVTSETQEYVAYATAEMKAKDDLIAELRSKLHDSEFGRDTDVRKLQQQMQTTLEASISAQRAMEADLREKLRVSENKLERSMQFLEKREEMELRIEELQTTLEAERSATKTAFQDLERKYLLDKSLLMKEHQAQYHELRRQARAEAQKSLDSDTKRILFENKQMGDEMKLQADETKVLARERQATAEQARVLAREVEIYADKEKEWARQGSRKTQENKALKAQILELESTLKAERADKDKIKLQLTKHFEKETENIRLELEGMQSLLRIKNRELTTLKRLAYVVLQQRTDIEQFFLDALSEVKLEIARKRKAAQQTSRNAFGALQAPLLSTGARPSPRLGIHKPGVASITLSVPGRSGMSFPGTGSMSSGSMIAQSPLRSVASAVMTGHSSVPATDVLNTLIANGGDQEVTPADGRKVNLSDLTAEDREKVLRLLFAKINNFKAPKARPVAPASVLSSDEECVPDEFEDAPESTMMQAPFGLTADIPMSLATMEVRTATGRPPARPPINSGSTFIDDGASRNTPLITPAPSFDFSSNDVGGSATQRLPSIMQGLLEQGVPLEDIPDTPVLAEGLSKKIADRNALAARMFS